MYKTVEHYIVKEKNLEKQLNICYLAPQTIN